MTDAAFIVMAGQDAITEDDIQDYVEGRTDAHRARAIEAWLALTPHRAREVAALIAQRDALRQVGSDILEEPVPSRLLDLLRTPLDR